ncbi:CLUMA_CG003960, isoform A [Clunio marinus]|uniref:isoleucine--tRNA ligase n=1 Tax=Clunio marinus TaxID=568069 RepID=A0A1J1HVS1_9DIPT|nr:CLUMA_CG003960, isoform A [Clunio marinus]
MIHNLKRLRICHEKFIKFLNRNVNTKVETEVNKEVKFTSTINLPKTKFPARLNSTQKTQTETSIIEKHLSSLYGWQRENHKTEDYVLHDGPPYANGDLHMGHAVNKILKDIILKDRIMKGTRVHYHPGWDCHGLPIELKALKNNKDVPPNQIRQRARKFAMGAIEKQRKSFECWGVTGSWQSETKTYKTFDKNYIKNQLQMFYIMYEKGLIYKAIKPVYWSPSSQTALAEAELEYDEKFVSPSLYFRCQITNNHDIVDNDVKLYALIWTTTPWTLPANQAICFNSNLNYCLVKISGDFYIVGSNTIENLSKELDLDVEFVKELNPKIFHDFKYQHPINEKEILPFFDGSHVQADKGTGLVHTAPSHGPDDFLVFLNKKIPLKSFVDGRGCYNSSAPDFLQGKEVLTEGNDFVIKHLDSSVVKLQEIKHSYPIDWRTKKPVIILASDQWFIDTERIKTKAIEEADKVEFFPQKSSHIYKNVLKIQLEKRPYWCISRQRSWGVPIPVLYDKTTKEPILNKNFLNHWIKMLEINNSMDFWWEKNVEELLPESSEFDVKNLMKGSDILDIWFDSGISWSYALDGTKVADLYLEGVDQMTAWFQSSLMTSVGIRDISPYKNIFVHGFVVDENGRKMSKSLGNVISPEVIVRKYGTDALRWWVAAHSTQHSSIPVSYKLLEDGVNNLIKIRLTLKYLLGVIGNDENDGKINEAKLTHLDKFILHKLSEFNENVASCYENFQFNKVVTMLNHFVNTDLSSCYLHLVKDRLYCGYDTEHCQLKKVLMNCYLGLSKSLWPIAPFLIEESWSYLKDESFYRQNFGELKKWNFKESNEIVNYAMDVRREFYSNIKDLNTWKLNVVISGNNQNLKYLKILHSNMNEPSNATELCEIFQVSSITLEQVNEADLQISYSEVDEDLCPRCRRFTTTNGVCKRCENVLKQKCWI